MDVQETSKALIEGSKFILTTLFSVGMFLGFINMIAELGTFEQLAGLSSNAPTAIILPVAMLTAFLIAIPSGAFAAGVLVLILPTLSALGLPSEAMGFVAIATGLGTQISPVQINVAALSEGFNLEIIDIIKKNVPYVISAFILVTILAVIFV
jgi:C4-dicarboxylate transporter